VDALKKGGEQMGQQMSQQFGVSMQPGQSGEDEGDGATAGDGTGDEQDRDGTGRNTRLGDQGPRQGGARDPLGRLTTEGASGGDEGDDVTLPEQMEQARTRAVQDELRRRGADRTRPADELRYIDRLLQGGDPAP